MLNKHVYFWIGVICTLLIAIPITLGVIWAIGEQSINLATLLFGTLLTMILFLVIILIFRDLILKRILGTTRNSIEDISNNIGNLVVGATRGNIEEVRRNSAEFSRTLIVWYTWTHFYKWVITTCVAIIGSFAVFAGTILLVEQNHQLHKANENTINEQTYKMIELSSTLTLFNSRNIVFEAYMDDKKIIPVNPPTKEKRALRHLLNHYEDISVQAEVGRLNIKVIKETVGGPMRRLLDLSTNYIKNTRCKYKGDAGLEIYKNYEIFVLCHIQSKSVTNIEQCKKNAQNNILSTICG